MGLRAKISQFKVRRRNIKSGKKAGYKVKIKGGTITYTRNRTRKRK